MLFRCYSNTLACVLSNLRNGALISLSLISLTACGGGGSGGDTPVPSDASLSIKAERSQVTAGDGQFSVAAAKTGTNLPVSWSLSDGAKGQLDQTTGDVVHYIPPASVSTASMEYITATIDYDSVTQHLHLKSVVSVQVSPQASSNTINILQYNVKGNSNPASGGWNVAAIRNKQLAIMANYRGPLDFIALEQATLDTNGTSLPLVSDSIGKTGWKTIVSHCYQDAIQLAYDSARWTPVNTLAQVQGRSTAQAGFGSCTSVGNNKSRPYNMVLFQRNGSNPAFQVMVVRVHMPHDAPDYIGWEMSSFFNNALMVAGAQSVDALKKSTNVIMIGDMNEVSDQNNYSAFFTLFGPLLASPQIETCCSDSRTPWQYKYDRLLSNGLQVPTASVPAPPGGVTYPLGNAEEHKPIVATVKF